MKKLLVVLVALFALLVTFVDGQVDVGTIIQVWREIQRIYENYADTKSLAPELVLKFRDPSGFDRALPVIWDESIDPESMKKSPFEVLNEGISQLVSKTKDGVDPKSCKLFYQMSSDGSAVVAINNDKDVAYLLTLEPDLDGRWRQVFVECGQASVKKNNENDNSGFDQNQYELATNAYRHAKGLQIPIDSALVERYNSELEEEMDMAGFEVVAEAVQILNMELDEYKAKIEEIGKSFEWPEKLVKILMAGGHAETTFEADKDLRFSQSEWVLRGHWVRVATVLSNDKTRISLTIATSKFKFEIPETERDQTVVQKFITKGGTIKRKYLKQIEYLMRAEGAEAASMNLAEPIIQQFPMLKQDL